MCKISCVWMTSPASLAPPMNRNCSNIAPVYLNLRSRPGQQGEKVIAFNTGVVTVNKQRQQLKETQTRTNIFHVNRTERLNAYLIASAIEILLLVRFSAGTNTALDNRLLNPQYQTSGLEYHQIALWMPIAYGRPTLSSFEPIYVLSISQQFLIHTKAMPRVHQSMPSLE